MSDSEQPADAQPAEVPEPVQNVLAVWAEKQRLAKDALAAAMRELDAAEICRRAIEEHNRRMAEINGR